MKNLFIQCMRGVLMNENVSRAHSCLLTQKMSLKYSKGFSKVFENFNSYTHTHTPENHKGYQIERSVEEIFFIVD